MTAQAILPAGYLPKEALPQLKKYAQGLEGEYPSSSLFKAINEIEGDSPLQENPAEAAGWGALRGVFPVPIGALPWAALSVVIDTLFTGDRSCTLLIVNDSPVPLVLKGEPLQRHGETYGVPLFPSNPPQPNYVPARTDEAVGFAMWSFVKSKIMGLGTEGTTGVLDFQPEPVALPRGFRVGWDVPEAGANSCGLSFDTTSSADGWNAKSVDDKEHFKANLTLLSNRIPASPDLPLVETAFHAWCSHSTKRGANSLLVVVISEEES